MSEMDFAAAARQACANCAHTACIEVALRRAYAAGLREAAAEAAGWDFGQDLAREYLYRAAEIERGACDDE